MTHPKVSMPKGACAYFHHPLMPPASIDITGDPKGRGASVEEGLEAVRRYRESGDGTG